MGTANAGDTVSALKSVEISNRTGVITASNFVLNSERKLKENIAKPKNLSKLDAIKIHQFNFKKDETKRIRYGVIVDEVETIAPELVYDDSETKTVSYIDLAMAKISRMEQRIKVLEKQVDKISELEKKIVYLEKQLKY